VPHSTDTYGLPSGAPKGHESLAQGLAGVYPGFTVLLQRALLSGRRVGKVQRWEHYLTIVFDPVAIEMLAEEIKGIRIPENRRRVFRSMGGLFRCRAAAT
jgi:hypothetical protein